MATASLHLIAALQRTAEKLSKGAAYQWGHMGNCNCGHLAQELTRYTKAEIHKRALLSRSGDWHEQLIDYCPTSGIPMDDVIGELLAAGLDIEDLKHLERLSDPKILKRLPQQLHYLRHNYRNDVVKYLQSWAELLQEEWLAKMSAPKISAPASGKATVTV
ncbi:hypothetical protein D770_07510 [Flammeovirgaceae bacterium 311]|nr:hypothetical protein D770_07510 [Flammeovirgaceae bacterium 311]